MFAKPDNKVFPGIIGHLRAVHPGNEWVLVAFGPGGSNPDSLEVEILAIDPWTVRESVADEHSKAALDAYILGDAAHRHPPAYGLGINNCHRYAYNLEWKTSFVQKGIAGRGLLSTVTQERQPIGADLVRESGDQLREFNHI